MDKIGLKFSLNLQDLAATAAAISFWELPDIKQQIIACLPTAKTYFGASSPYSHFAKDYPPFLDEVTVKVIQRSESFHLPGKVRKGIQEMIPLIGEQILAWAMDVIYEFKLTPRHLEKIYWMSIGLIDTSKFFEVHRNEFHSMNFLPTFTLEALKGIDSKSYLCCSNADLKNAVKYYTSQADNCEIGYSILTVIEVTYRDLNYKFGFHLNSSLHLKLLQIVMNLINDLPVEKFPERICYVVLMFLDAWPYQELALQIICWVYDKKIAVKFNSILHNIFFFLNRTDSTQYNKRKKMHLKIFQNLLDIMQAQGVKFYDSYYLYSSPYEHSLICFRKVLRIGDFQFLNRFLDVVACFDEEKKFLPLCDKILCESLIEITEEKNFELAKKLADWKKNGFPVPPEKKQDLRTGEV